MSNKYPHSGDEKKKVGFNKKVKICFFQALIIKEMLVFVCF